MHLEFALELLERDGRPQVRVPAGKAWDLVEYLAQQRVQVTYSFEAGRLLVRFTHMSLDRVRELLEDWQHAAERELAESGMHAR
jgi:hypothetical protein